MSIISIATTVSSVASAVASIASAVASVASTTTSTNVNKEENTMSNSVASTTASTNSVVNDQTFDAAYNNTCLCVKLGRLNVLSNYMMNIVEMYRNETNPELIMEGLNKCIDAAKAYIDTYYELPEEYKTKATKKTEEWLGTLAGNNFEDIVSSSIKFSRGLYRDLLAEAMNN